ncbi:MAG: hypothetical protein GY759_19755 [Chloroflexi bacterium]|nr:hypothetical protein [Chloroflexota bacterium]
MNTSSYLSDGFEGTAVAYSIPSGNLPIRPSLVGVGDLMYADGHADGNRAAIYEATGQ